MIKRIILLLFFIIITSLAYSNEEKSIIFSDKTTGKVVGELTLEEFKSMLTASQNYLKILDSEEKGKIKVNALVEKINEDIVISNIVIRYFDDSGDNYKTLYIPDSFKINENTDLFYKLKKHYFVVSGYSLPLLLLIILLIL